MVSPSVPLRHRFKKCGPGEFNVDNNKMRFVHTGIDAVEDDTKNMDAEPSSNHINRQFDNTPIISIAQ